MLTRGLLRPVPAGAGRAILPGPMQSVPDVPGLAARHPRGEPATPPRPYSEAVELTFTGEIWFWRGPAPWHFVTVPADECAALEAIAPLVTYGWGMVPVTVRIGGSEWASALWPKDGGYIVPIKTWVREAEGLDVADVATIRLTVAAP